MTRHLLPAEGPITEDDAFIEAALRDASIPTLMMSMIHMSGDTSLLDGPVRPKTPVMNEFQGYLSEDDKAQIRTQALNVIRKYRDGGSQLPPPPSIETVKRMMDFLVGTAVSEDLVPFMLEEMSLDGVDARVPPWTRVVDDAEKQRFHVVVIGAGMAGLLSALRLKEAGIPYTVIEKNPEVGGTWFENRYPGCRVDINNHFYSYSFEPKFDWNENFSRQPELLDYFRRFADKYGLRDSIRFETEVASCRYDDASSTWTVTTRDAQGKEQTLKANAVISAVGQLNRPMTPEIPGRDRFKGPQLHTAAWDPSVDLSGKRVAVIGTGASAFQLVPELAKNAEQLTVFQRSPVWMFPNPDYHATVSESMKWLLRKLPYYARWFRFLVFWPGSGATTIRNWTIDPSWPHQTRSVSAANDQERINLTEWMARQVGDDAELLKKVVPDYPPGGKRMLQDNGGWLRALKQPNVELVTDGIANIDETGVVGTDGRHHDVDAIAYATGFLANKFLWPMEITGAGGVKLSDFWGDEPRAYLGITMPSFPNLFCCYGPGTNLAHAGSLFFNAECQVRYIVGALKHMIENGYRRIEVKPAVYESFNSRQIDALDKLVWSHPSVNNWYKNSRGRVVTTSPWELGDYWKWTRAPELEDFELS